MQIPELNMPLLLGSPFDIAEGETTLPETAPAAAPLAQLTRAHYSRLRFYWVNRGQAPVQGTALDLTLHALGLIRPNTARYSLSSSYQVTEAGVALLAARSELEKQRRAPHHELGARVAQWMREKGRMTWEGIEFRVRDAECSKKSKAMAIAVTTPSDRLFATPRPDVFSVVPSMTESRIEPWVHEVKVSRADFLSDVANPSKRLAYAQICERLFYVVPAGLVAAAEVPAACGLVYEHKPGEFEVVSRAKKMPVTLTAAHFMNMVVKRGAMPGTESGP